MEYEWDPAKAKANLRKHGVSFADAVLALEDPQALTVADPDASGEQRFVSLGLDPNGRVLVTVFAPEDDAPESSLHARPAVTSGGPTRASDAQGI